MLPIFVNRNTLSSAITDTSTTVLHMPYLYYVINTLWNGFILYKLVDRYYLILYLVLIIGFGILNPYQLLNTVVPMWNVFGITFLLMILLKLFQKDFIITLIIFLLTIVSQMCFYSFSYQPTFVFLGVMFLYIIGYALLFKKQKTDGVGKYAASPLIVTAAFGQTIFQSIYSLGTIQKSGIFLLISGMFLYLYTRTITKKYYGGDLLVNDPISLDKITPFTIKPTYHSTLSCWFYLTPTNSGENTLLFYGDQLLVTYDPDLNSLRIHLKDQISYVESKVLLQKWNHFAFVYENGKLIIFMNGDVIHTSEWSPPSFKKELLIGKIQGKMCHIRFYNKALDMRSIEGLYENFKNKNPPIV